MLIYSFYCKFNTPALKILIQGMPTGAGAAG